jgi:hypothetical protein
MGGCRYWLQFDAKREKAPLREIGGAISSHRLVADPMQRTGSSSQPGSAVAIRYALPAEAQAALDKRRRKKERRGLHTTDGERCSTLRHYR